MPKKLSTQHKKKGKTFEFDTVLCYNQSARVQKLMYSTFTRNLTYCSSGSSLTGCSSQLMVKTSKFDVSSGSDTPWINGHVEISFESSEESFFSSSGCGPSDVLLFLFRFFKWPRCQLGSFRFLELFTLTGVLSLLSSALGFDSSFTTGVSSTASAGFSAASAVSWARLRVSVEIQKSRNHHRIVFV